MTVASSAMSAQRRRLAAQALIATRDRLAADTAALLTPVSVPTLEVTSPAMTTPAIAALSAQIQDLLASLAPAAPVAPVAPVSAPVAKPEPFKDPVVVGINALGVPLNAAGAFVSRKRAVDPQGLIKAYDAAKAAPKPTAKPKAPAPTPAPVAPAAADLGATLAQLEQLLTALATPPTVTAPPAATAPTGTLDSLVRRDGQWFRCLQCEDAYWGTFRDEAFVLAKASKHVAAKHKA